MGIFDRWLRTRTPTQPEMLRFSCACGAKYGIEKANFAPGSNFLIRCSTCGGPVNLSLDRLLDADVENSPWMATTTTSFELCISWLNALLATPMQLSNNTTASPWTFAPPCSLDDVISFQNEHKVELPQDYIRFVTEFGNGTISGGAFSVFALGMALQDDGNGPPIPFVPLTC